VFSRPNKSSNPSVVPSIFTSTKPNYSTLSKHTDLAAVSSNPLTFPSRTGIAGFQQFSTSIISTLWWGFGRWLNSTLALTLSLDLNLLALTMGPLALSSLTSRVLLTGSSVRPKRRWAVSAYFRSQKLKLPSRSRASYLPLWGSTVHPSAFLWSPYILPKSFTYGLSGETSPSYVPSRFIHGGSISRLVKRWRRNKKRLLLPTLEATTGSTLITRSKFLSYVSKKLLASDFLANSTILHGGAPWISSRLSSDRRYQTRRNRRLSRDERLWSTPYLFLRFSQVQGLTTFRSRSLMKLFSGALKSSHISNSELFLGDLMHLNRRASDYLSFRPALGNGFSDRAVSSSLSATRHYHYVLRNRMNLIDNTSSLGFYNSLGFTSISRPATFRKNVLLHESSDSTVNPQIGLSSTLSSLSPSLLSVLRSASQRRLPLLQSRFRRPVFASRRRLRYVRYTISRYRRLALRLKGTLFNTAYRSRFHRAYSRFVGWEDASARQLEPTSLSSVKTLPRLASPKRRLLSFFSDSSLPISLFHFLTDCRYLDWSSYVFRRLPHVRRHRTGQILAQKLTGTLSDKSFYLTTLGKLRVNGLLRRDKQYVGYTSRTSLASHFLSPSDAHSRLGRHSFNVRRSYLNRKLKPYLALRKSRTTVSTSTFAARLRSLLSLGHENRFSYLSNFITILYKSKPSTPVFSGGWFRNEIWPVFNVSNLSTQSHRSFVPTSSLTFSRNSFFASQLFTLVSLLPDLARSESRKFFYFEPFDFVNYKQVKKTLFRRLVAQKYRADRNLGIRPHLRSRMEGHYADFQRPGSGSLASTAPTSSLASFFTMDHYRTSRFLFDHIHGQWRGSRPIGLPVIRKTRFKPGYPRMWRHERRIIKEVTGLTHRYQYRLTTKLQLLFFSTRKATSFQNSMRLDYALILSHFAPDQFTSEKLLTNEYVYLNGSLTTNGLIHLFTNDFIQLVVSLRFYVLSKWIKGWSSLKFKKWMRRFYRTYRIKRQLFREFKFRSLPDSVMDLQNSWYDIPKSLEVDFFTLSSFVIVGNFRHFMQFPHHSNNLRVRILNMYNWKYIT